MDAAETTPVKLKAFDLSQAVINTGLPFNYWEQQLL